MAALKQLLFRLYQERIVEPIMEVLPVSASRIARLPLTSGVVVSPPDPLLAG